MDRKRRNAVVPKRLQDNGLTKHQIRGVSTPTSAKCLILMSNHDETWVLADKLQTELGDPLSKNDLVVGGTVIYRYRGKPYKGEILEVKSGDCEKNKAIVDESKSEDEEVQEVGTATKRRRKEVTIEDSDSELDTSPKRVTKSKYSYSRKAEMSDSEYDKENRDWTTPKSAKVSCRKRKYYDEDEEELDYVRRKEKVTNKLVIPDDDYLTSADKTPTHFGFPLHGSRNPYGERNVYDILESHTRSLHDLQKSVSKVLKYLKQLPSSVDIKRTPVVHGPGPVKEEMPVKDADEDDQFVTEDGVNLLSLRAELPKQYALTLMDALFTIEEMGTHCFKENSKTTKPGLDVKRVRLLEDCIKRKFGKELFDEKAADIRQRCNQKCLDKKRILANSNKEQ